MLNKIDIIPLEELAVVEASLLMKINLLIQPENKNV